MSVPKFQHYVPRFYLARFADAGGFLSVFDKQDDRVFCVKPQNISGENHFYDLPELEQYGGARTLMEEQFAELEGQAHRITECWLNQCSQAGLVEIPDVNREIMSLFLTLQLLRTAEARIVLRQFVQLLQSSGAISADYDAGNDIQALHGALLWDEELLKSIREKIADCIWIFGRNSSAKPFITSDHPALIKTGDNRRWMLGPRVFDEGMYVVLPLSPTLIWYCKDRKYWQKVARFDCAVSPVVFTEDMVNHENSGQVGMCSRFVFSNSPDFEFARDYCKSAPGVVNRDRNRFEELPPLA